MTYCLAWKQNGCIFMVGDSLMSSRKLERFHSNESSIGEVHGEYGGYYVEETSSKIFHFKDILIAFSVNEWYYNEIVEIIELQLNVFEFKVILQNICNSYSHTAEFELLIAKKNGNSNLLYYVNGSSVELIENYKSIGSGKNIDMLTETLWNFTRGFEFDVDDVEILVSKMVVFLQIIIYKNGFLEFGVGGTVCGACLKDEIKWNQDLFYLFYEKNFDQRMTLNVIVRDSILLTGSDYSHINKIFASLGVKPIHNKFEYIRKLLKIINTTSPRIVVYYSRYYNCIYFVTL
ncbi:hypothetical protein CA600_07000 [Paenibacillus sp. VTT E-133280]|uniref:hypothetical protein n=1 Tax=Paenibacillus sp. VTT E-133280 TaxID=1986222 RepID=UPI000BA0B06B|nr:hypothetical protein [Paenibacillus sp. VTT E-133280]OZQ68004.1 hypothetical protein CA600_07000 [Paenibacillus sp. VTT E-133280]